MKELAFPTLCRSTEKIGVDAAAAEDTAQLMRDSQRRRSEGSRMANNK